MRRFMIALVILLAIILITTRFPEGAEVVQSLERGSWWWLGLGVLIQFVLLCNVALVYRAVYHLLGLQASLGRLLPLAVTSNFVNTVAPSGGVGGVAIFITDAR